MGRSKIVGHGDPKAANAPGKASSGVAGGLPTG